MYYLIKLIQAAGLTLILFAFIRNFPELMDVKILGVGILIFALGWTLQKLLLVK